MEVVNLGEEGEMKEVKMGTGMTKETQGQLYALLKEFKHAFAWSYQDMPGLDPSIVQHKLPLRPECLPVKQKLRRMKPEVSLKIKEEVEKQFSVGFLAVAKYPQWASPKDNFPLLHIDTLVDNTAKSALFPFMDGFLGYNQIRTAPVDLEKTTFITLRGTFCYKVMPSGLKNAGQHIKGQW